MTKKFFQLMFFLSFIFAFSSQGKVALAEEKMAESSAVISSQKMSEDKRAEKLNQFLRSYHSPLAPYSDFIVKTADRYSLDWKLVPAISGVESSFGQHIPFNSFNAYGWNNGNYYFQDWQDGIKTVSLALRENYIDRGAKTVEQIGPIYAESPTWSQRVAYFMEKIEAFNPSSLQFSL